MLVHIIIQHRDCIMVRSNSGACFILKRRTKQGVLQYRSTVLVPYLKKSYLFLISGSNCPTGFTASPETRVASDFSQSDRSILPSPQHPPVLCDDAHLRRYTIRLSDNVG